ncbi:MAG: PRK06851 family protein [Eubacteriaceae bacterium]
MNNNRVKKIFPGGNTTKGFYSYYDFINKRNPNRTFILKGGPGVGKSSFMKKIGQEMLERGYSIEEHYCSSSNDSLDAVVISKLKVAIIDGTAPHIVDPKNPGAIDEIINLGEYWNVNQLEKNKIDSIKVNKEVEKYFIRAYQYLKVIDSIIQNIAVVYNEGMNIYNYYQLQENLLHNIFNGVKKYEKIGYHTHFFGSAITPNGVVDYLETLVGTMENIYFVKGTWGTGWSDLLDEVSKKAIRMGYDVEVYHTPFAPEMIEDIVIPELNLAITTNKKFVNNCTSIIDLELLVDKDILNKYISELKFDEKMFNQFLIKSIESINNAKLLHHELESFYIPNMHFDDINKKRNEILHRILKYETVK